MTALQNRKKPHQQHQQKEPEHQHHHHWHQHQHRKKKEQNLTSTPTRNIRSVSVDSYLLENENLNTRKKTDNYIRLFKTFRNNHKN
ncbi:hypothetical protein DPMN_109144 [Dreissena polymorpha]|uniref:Uncharacterized protein n=1 Tax=Dreissena polymorpha TaxID=45954 RepID=A0A9D4KAJ6_DREPO|nr:hypothetical protein DPMN_109144 [Dreissena polymorpha]